MLDGKGVNGDGVDPRVPRDPPECAGLAVLKWTPGRLNLMNL